MEELDGKIMGLMSIQMEISDDLRLLAMSESPWVRQFVNGNSDAFNSIHDGSYQSPKMKKLKDLIKSILDYINSTELYVSDHDLLYGLLKEELIKLMNAMKLRGFKKQTTLHSYKGYAYLIGILVVKSYERAQQIYAAMLCRGFKGQLHFRDEFELAKRDLALLLIIVLFSFWLLA